MTTGRKLGLVCIVAAVAIALLWLLTPRRNTESKVAVLAKTEATDSPSASSAIQDEPWTRGEVPSVVTDPTPGRASESPAIPMHPEVTLEQLPRVVSSVWKYKSSMDEIEARCRGPRREFTLQMGPRSLASPIRTGSSDSTRASG